MWYDFIHFLFNHKHEVPSRRKKANKWKTNLGTRVVPDSVEELYHHHQSIANLANEIQHQYDFFFISENNNNNIIFWEAWKQTNGQQGGSYFNIILILDTYNVYIVEKSILLCPKTTKLIKCTRYSRIVTDNMKYIGHFAVYRFVDKRQV